MLFSRRERKQTKACPGKTKTLNLFIILRKAGEEKETGKERRKGRRKEKRREARREEKGGKEREKKRWKEKAGSNLINLESLSLWLRPRCSSILLHVNRALFW